MQKFSAKKSWFLISYGLRGGNDDPGVAKKIPGGGGKNPSLAFLKWGFDFNNPYQAGGGGGHICPRLFQYNI